MAKLVAFYLLQSMSFFWKRAGFGRGTFSPRVTHTFRLPRFIENIHVACLENIHVACLGTLMVK